MKTILIGALALSLAGGSVATAQGYYGGQDRGHDNGRGDNQDNGRGYGQDNGRGYGRDRQMHRGWGHDYNGPHQWRRGQRMGYNDWNGAQRVDYRRYNLRQPPYGYEWRESNGQYVLAAVATGLIASIILNSNR